MRENISQRGQLRHIPALDGFRAIAILLVLGYHAGLPGMDGGYFGVDLFFVLSGFLISTILLNEAQATGTISLSRFYMRRIRRLTPALVILLLGYIALAPFAWPQASLGHHIREVAYTATYLSDYMRAFTGVPALLGHTWSLAVEEHFYMLWPFALMALLRRFPLEKLPRVLAALFIIATLWRIGCFVAGQEWEEVYFRFDTRLSGLLLGAWLASLALIGKIPSYGKFSLAGSAGFFLFTVIFAAWGTAESLTACVVFAELFAVVLIAHLAAHERSVASRLLSLPVFVFIGRISYGLYLYHSPILYYLSTNYGVGVAVAIGVPVSIALAAASYYLIEKRFLASPKA